MHGDGGAGDGDADGGACDGGAGGGGADDAGDAAEHGGPSGELRRRPGCPGVDTGGDGPAGHMSSEPDSDGERDVSRSWCG